MGFWVAERPMRRGPLVGEGFEAFERKSEVCAALVVGYGVDFVDYHGCDVAENGAAAVCG